ncbi:C25 family cysteine peptidase [Arenicella xantha]|uniref:Peptidase C25-like protein n=1 Tax=Arenicella xantha TaxID=644221 RepID=A0A395JND8_9GAMM|nr:C25 family cysteine peptidase [Arenicella xantha]RBP53171.1 peptidase C25-like protein [Arenicella xantha]
MRRLFIQLLTAATALGFAATVSATELFKIVTTESGMHRLKYQELFDKGADLAGLPVRNIALTLNGEPVQVRVVGQSVGSKNTFGPGGSIEFYAEQADSLYSKESVYVLHLVARGDSRGMVKSIPSAITRVVDRIVPAQSYLHTEIVEKNNTYDFAAPSATDPFHFGQTFSFFTTPSYNFTLDNVAGGSASAKVSVEMYGLLDFDIEGNDHHFEVLVNGNLVGDQQFDGATATVLDIEDVPVQSGDNAFRYKYRSIAGVPFDRITLNKFSVTYPRTTDVSGSGYLEGYFDTEQAMVVGVGNAASVYRKLENGELERLERGVEARGDGVVFSTGGVAADYIVVAEDAYTVPEIEAIPDYQDISSGIVDYLVIAHPSLIGDELQELADLRAQDYAVKVVDVDQVYAQYGNHIVGADAIENYVSYAANNMQAKMVMLIGSDTLDYKKLISNSISLLPTKYVTTPGGALTITQTPSDAAYGDLNDDGVPDIPTGRISARTKQELANVVAKIKAYEAREGYIGRTVVATDKQDVGNGVSFADDAQDLIDAIPSAWSDGIRADFRAFPDVDGHQQAHDKLINLINSGVSVVSYIGHSSQQSWSYTTPPMMRAVEVAGLTNVGKPTVVTQWGCWNTYFVDISGNTMADAFLLTKDVGAATVLGASTLTSSTGERALGIELNKRLYTEGMTIGDAVIQAKKALVKVGDFPAVQLGWQILGDVALKINN